MNRITDPSLRKTISLFYLTKSFWKTFSMYLKQAQPSYVLPIVLFTLELTQTR